MTAVRQPPLAAGSRHLTYITDAREQTGTHARLTSEVRLAEVTRGGRFHPVRLDTYDFCRLRCKPIASRLEAGLCIGADAAARRVVAALKMTMNDICDDSTTDAQLYEDHAPIAASSPTIDTVTGTDTDSVHFPIENQMHRVAQDTEKDPVHENRSTGEGSTGYSQDAQDNDVYSQTNDTNSTRLVRAVCACNSIEKTPIILCILFIGESPRRRVAKIVHRIDSPTLCNPVHLRVPVGEVTQQRGGDDE